MGTFFSSAYFSTALLPGSLPTNFVVLERSMKMTPGVVLDMTSDPASSETVVPFAYAFFTPANLNGR